VQEEGYWEIGNREWVLGGWQWNSFVEALEGEKHGAIGGREWVLGGRAGDCSWVAFWVAVCARADATWNDE
jgi:hypothetical protein